jgi:gamma-glutamylputrescine oxidase
MAVDWGTVYWRQIPDGTILLGGYRNLDPDTEIGPALGINPMIQQGLADFLPGAFPGFPVVKVRARWSGLMDATADGRPLIGPLNSARNRWIIAGFGGHGLPVGLGAGQALAEAITTGRLPTILEPYDPCRFFVKGQPCERNPLPR